MSSRFGRREFLKKSVGAAALAAGASAVGVPAILAERSPNSKLNTAVIGANGRGMAHVPVAAGEHLVAMVDIDDRRMGSTLDWLDKNCPGVRSKVKTYYDYRKMFDEMHKQVDAVFIAIPDHSHACATMMAIKLGKHVYCEKPLTHDIYEARALGQAARQYKVMTQMGNQGHAGESIRVLREYLEAGAIGTVLETHTWTSQYYGDKVRQTRRAGADRRALGRVDRPRPLVPLSRRPAPWRDTAWYYLERLRHGPAALRGSPCLRRRSLGPAIEVPDQRRGLGAGGRQSRSLADVQHAAVMNSPGRDCRR